MSSNYLVGIRCSTYNQKQYIEQTLNGFVIQQTTFPFIAMIVDDASTDGQQNLILSYIEKNFDTADRTFFRKDTAYAEVLFARHQKNRNCYFVVLFLKENHYQKNLSYKKLEYLAEWRNNLTYEALCEGDDWWTDSTKLQKQVDFLDAHPEYLMCCTSYSSVRMKDGYIIKGGESGDGRDITFRMLMKKNMIGTLTVMYRRDIFFKYQTEVIPYMPKFLLGDLPLWLYIASQGKIHKLPYDMANYRILESSASHYEDFDGQCKFLVEARRIRLWINRYLGTHYTFYIWVRLLIDIRLLCRRWAKAHNESRITLWRKALFHIKNGMSIKK